MGEYIDHRLVARPEPDNTFWDDSSNLVTFHYMVETYDSQVRLIFLEPRSAQLDDEGTYIRGRKSSFSIYSIAPKRTKRLVLHTYHI